MINHRGPEFGELLRETTTALGRLIGTDGEVFLLTGSGTGSLEAAVVNVLSPGDRVLAVSIGAFGDRFAKIAEIFGATVERLEFDWGTAADPARVAAHLADEAPYRAVLLTHNETSTGVANPLPELVAAVRGASGEPLVLVDGISGLGAMPFEMDAWGVDLVVSASQKAFMASPGIAIAAVGARARERGGRRPHAPLLLGLPRGPDLGREGPDALDPGGERALRLADRGRQPGGRGPGADLGTAHGARRRHGRRARGAGPRPGGGAGGPVGDGHRRLAAGRPGVGDLRRRDALPRAGGGRRPGKVDRQDPARRSHGRGELDGDRRDAGGHGRGAGRGGRSARRRRSPRNAVVPPTRPRSALESPA